MFVKTAPLFPHPNLMRPGLDLNIRLVNPGPNYQVDFSKIHLQICKCCILKIMLIRLFKPKLACVTLV